MDIRVNGTRLWFDVDGPALVPDGSSMRERPVLVLVHGGPGTYDHSYFKPWFAALTDTMQIVYLDLRGHGRSEWGRAEDWDFEVCADDVRAFCDALGLEHPFVLGHSMGGFVAMLYGARHPGHAAGLILAGTNARFDLERLVEGVRRQAGDEVAALARRDYRGDEVTAAEWARVFAAFGPHRPSEEELGRRLHNRAVSKRGMELMTRFDVVKGLDAVTSPTLVCVGALDGVMPVGASEEIVAALSPGIGRLEVLAGAGHFAWLDDADAFFAIVRRFVLDLTTRVAPLARTSP